MKLTDHRSWLAVTAAATLVAAGLTVATTTAAQAASGCQVSYTVSSQWPGGFGANVNITNLGSAVSSWNLTWSFGAGQTITQLWNGTYTQSGANVTVTNVSYNGSIGTGATTNLGFNGTWNSSNPVPASFALNGTTCTGGVSSGTPTPTMTTGSPTPTPTQTSASPSPSSTPSASPSGTTPPPGQLPCDLYAAGGTPCISAHSTTRALYAAYSGPLYQVQRSSDHSYRDIGLLSAGGVVNASAQSSFCSGTSCTITKIYDQSPEHNDLPISPGGFWKGPGPNGSDIGANATALPITIGGHSAYGIKVTPGVGYRTDAAKGAPTGSQPEGIYMVTSSNNVNQYCCFDYGSGETNNSDDGNATMNAIYWGTACWFGGCVGSGPWVEADLENGMYHTNTGSNKNSNNQGVHFPFVSAWEKNNGTSNFTLKYGNADSGGLTTPYSGPLPNGYSPMKLQASILLGTGGDNSSSDYGEFFEGAVTAGYPSDATENAVQASIVAAGYQ
ncbi:cellulose binding domain-containing protein [Actinocrinis puniceicyclus]|uniref:Cellulose binding domain-containing protein n=1 Tax=Actinocrinis puniceicyclus TaxID=977794 RepID=A0A8J7WQG7_9ACTN|nr:arabinofuranosidase catalytic domain-containing protein [Actinocrinis puniceicyclus]MBS2966613.1 cellulose binding domain-containing protein [Actinocrinis puniceicyclus]